MDERALADLAGRQRGVVSIRQLRAAGFDNAAIKRRCRAGRLHRLHRGIYLVGHCIAPEGAAEVAALFACGPESVVSHRSAGRLWKLPAFRNWRTPVDVTVPGRDPGRKPGIEIHRARKLRPRDVRRLGGIPLTAPARTLLDVAALLAFDDLVVAFADARQRQLLPDRDVAELLARSRGRRGAKALRRVVELGNGDGLTRSQAERRLLALVRAAGLHLPKANARVGRFEVDFLWQDQKLIVEVDGYAFHSGERSFERDRERDATLVAGGYVVVRVTWRQLIARQQAVVARIAAALAIRS